jgi:hypothetical protein
LLFGSRHAFIMPLVPSPVSPRPTFSHFFSNLNERQKASIGVPEAAPFACLSIRDEAKPTISS